MPNAKNETKKKLRYHNVGDSFPLDSQDARPDVVVLGPIISRLASTNTEVCKEKMKKKRTGEMIQAINVRCE